MPGGVQPAGRAHPRSGWPMNCFQAVVECIPCPQAKVEDEVTGCPGVCNLLNARTKWLDGAMARAISDGFRQVKHPMMWKHDDNAFQTRSCYFLIQESLWDTFA